MNAVRALRVARCRKLLKWGPQGTFPAGADWLKQVTDLD